MKNTSLMRWVITGGCGFIGSSLVRTLCDRELASGIRIVDDLSAGQISSLPPSAVLIRDGQFPDWGDSPAGKGIPVIEGDVRDAALAIKVCQGADIVVHLAANTGVQLAIEDPGKDADINIRGTLSYLEAARHAGVKSFVFASSGAPTGNVAPPIHEDVACRPMSPYGASKLAGEAYCSAYFWSYDLKTVALRFSNVYGPGSGHKTSVVARFIKQALEGTDWTIFGDGGQTRDFIYIDDLIEALILARNAPNGGELYQISTNHECSINELAELLGKVLAAETGRSVAIAHGEQLKGELARNYAINSKAKRDLGWEPARNLEEGLRQTVKWFVRTHEDEAARG